MKRQSSLFNMHKSMNSKWIIGLNIKLSNISISKKNHTTWFLYPWVKQWILRYDNLNIMHKLKINKLDFIKIKNPDFGEVCLWYLWMNPGSYTETLIVKTLLLNRNPKTWVVTKKFYIHISNKEFDIHNTRVLKIQ
jgi:hypothetical protein